MNFKNQLEDYNLTNVKLAPQCMPFMHNFFSDFFFFYSLGQVNSLSQSKKGKIRII